MVRFWGKGHVAGARGKRIGRAGFEVENNART